MSDVVSGSERSDAPAWWCLLVLVALVPVALGAAGASLPGGTWDPFGLPKAVVVIALAASAVIAVSVAVARGGRLYGHPALWPAAAALVWAAAATAFAVSRSLSVYGEYMRNDGLVALLAQVAVLFLAVQLVRGARRLRTLMVTACGAGSAVAAYALLQRIGADPIAWPAGGFGDRIFATYGNPDLLAAFLVFPFVLSIGLALASEKTGPLALAWGSAGLTGAALTLSLVRGAWIAAALGVVLVGAAALVGRVALRRVDLLGGAGVAATLVLAAVAGGSQEGLSVGERLGTLSSDPAAGSLGTRFLLWRGGLDAVLDRPLLGWGPDAFQRAFARHAPIAYYREWSAAVLPDNAHNYAVQLAVTIGVVGAALVLLTFAWALVASARTAFARSQRRSQMLSASVWAACVAMLVVLATAVSMPGVTVWVWLCAGMLLAPFAQPVSPPRSAAVIGAVASSSAAAALIALALSWVVADAMAATALRNPDPVQRALGLERALRVNPLPQRYRIVRADAYNQAVTEAAAAGVGTSDLEPMFAQAADAFGEAAARDRSDVESRIQLASAFNQAARIFPQSGYDRRAFDAATEAVDLAPRDVDALTQLSTAALGVGNVKAAEKAARTALGVLPDYVPAWTALGAAAEAGDDRTAARRAYEKALRIAPTDAEAQAGLSRVTEGD